jgi:hypothetical protein
MWGMPTPETLERFIAMVEQNLHADAIEQFYAPGASIQENQSAPRKGRNSSVAHERRVLAKAKKVISKCIRPVAVNLDHVFIRWTFHFEWLDGSIADMEEIACQRWEGEQIAEETFFYDPAQRIPRVVKL